MELPRLRHWSGERLGPVEVLPVVDSTNAEALRRVERGDARDGLVLVAERQEAGRGSRGRAWSHLPGKSIALTVLLRASDERPPHLATWAAVVAATTDTFQVSLTSGGAAVDITGIGEMFHQKVVPEVFAAQGQITVAVGALVLDITAM